MCETVGHRPRVERTPAATSWLLCASAYVLVGFSTLAAALTLAIGHREKMETGLYVVVFVVLVPAGLVLARRQLVRTDAAAEATLAVLNVSAVALLVVLARCAWFTLGARAVSAVFVLGGVAICLANLGIFLEKAPVVGRSHRGRMTLEIVAGSLIVVALLSFFPSGFFTPARIIVCLVVAAGISTVYLGRAVIKPGNVARRIVDAIVVLIMILVVTDVRRYGDLFRYDYDFFLGPANAIEHGHAMLVETFSQYGVGMPVALAGVFQLLPLTYGGLQAVLSIGYAIEFALVYCVLRLACRSQFIAVTGLSVAMVANLVLPGISPMAFPSVGPLRFGLPWVIVLAGVLAMRPGKLRRTYQIAGFCALAVAAIWSFETLVYAAGTYLAMVALGCATDDGPRTRRALAFVGFATVAAGVCAASIAAFTLLTRAFAGAWPDWGTYLGLIATYSVREFGTLLIPSWSPGYAIASIYVISALGLLVAIATRTTGASRHMAVTAIAGTTAYGALSFTYFLGRSEPTNLHHVAIPAVVAVCCWADLLQTMSSSSRRLVAVGGTALVALVGSAVLTHNLPWTADWINGSPLAQGIRSPTMVVSETRDLFRREPARPDVAESSRLLTQYHRTGRPVAVLLHVDLLTNALLASGTGNALPIVNGNQDRLTGEKARELVRTSIARMSLPAYVLTDDTFLRRAPASFAGKDLPVAGDRRYGDYFIALALSDVRRRFTTRVVARGSQGLVVLELRQHVRESSSSPS